MAVNSPDNTADAGPSIFLEYGVDGERCNDSEIRICARGMCFKSRWQFELGTELAIALTHRDSRGELERLDLQGTIAACEKVCRNCYQITMIFIDFPDEARPLVAEIARQIRVQGGTKEEEETPPHSPDIFRR